MQIDGGNIKDKSLEKRSFEALAAKIYKPEAVTTKGKRTVIKDKIFISRRNPIAAIVYATELL